ncbi:MAG: prepilin-type N-terminal cleavage/methylation domain-containing protein, partial [Pyrinomonadaceae bacterium]
MKTKRQAPVRRDFKGVTELETNTRTSRSTAGFSLIEVVIALVILMIALLGVFSVFT